MENELSWQNNSLLIAHRALLNGPDSKRENTFEAFKEVENSSIKALETDVLESGLIAHDPPEPGKTTLNLIEILPFAKTLLINLELKSRSNANFKAVFDTINAQETLPKHHLLFSSFTPKALADAKTHCPEIKRALLIRDDTLDILKTAQDTGVTTINLADKLATPERLQDLTPHFKVMVYTINTQPRIDELLSAGVHGIFTDYAATLHT